MVEVSMRFEFSTINNHGSYEVVIVDISLAGEMDKNNIKVRTNSQLVISQVKGKHMIMICCNNNI